MLKKDFEKWVNDHEIFSSLVLKCELVQFNSTTASGENFKPRGAFMLTFKEVDSEMMELLQKAKISEYTQASEELHKRIEVLQVQLLKLKRQGVSCHDHIVIGDDTKTLRKEIYVRKQIGRQIQRNKGLL